jgi:23S rRNA (uridine2552-2'-O)-methyltransferase
VKKKQSKGGSSSRWLARQQNDFYVRKARESRFRSRAVFKLEQLDLRDRLFRPGHKVLDLGAAPGGWSQYLAGRVGDKGRVVAVDLLPVLPIPGVTIVEGDFLDKEVVQSVVSLLDGEKMDAIVSDMAPNLSGIRDRDEARALELIDAALSLPADVLRDGGLMVVKIFEGKEKSKVVDRFRAIFSQVGIRKPDASRRDSSECYIVARGYNRRTTAVEQE